ncbi:hypothetical protein [Candidatus Absconditicoccus praedator]|uniref:hypothetical protein n=1 Tax=Candidatus Absconditicoccus praedator TaxID=2735562 RepID=UPI001E4C8D17|nr:hypothetical protein [Candidatus Absconditicoccus praedator]UFX82968.1 hypothetical protein HLG78_02435 [Candidatus Absconditicoccus praedator]
MLLVIAIVLISIGTALTMNIYAIFDPFIENLGDIRDYNIAYYGATASIERANLALRYHDAGFEGEGGWKGQDEYGETSDHNNKQDFGSRFNIYGNGMKRNISSRISGDDNENNNNPVIPRSNDGNIDLGLRGVDSEHYNILGYNMTEEFKLFLDDGNDPYEESSSDIDIVSNLDAIKGKLRLPPEIKSSFSNRDLCDDTCDSIGDGITDDIVVNRILSGESSDGNFTINPQIDVNYDTGIVGTEDSAIREDVINSFSAYNLYFDTSKNPIEERTRLIEEPANHDIVPSNHDFLDKNFREIFDETEENLSIRFSLVNDLITSNIPSEANLYPFLEYQFEFEGPDEIPDRFFNISGVGQVGDYRVEIIQRKPTSQRTAASDFAIVF